MLGGREACKTTRPRSYNEAALFAALERAAIRERCGITSELTGDHRIGAQGADATERTTLGVRVE